MLVSLSQHDIANMIQGLGDPKGDNVIHSIYESNGYMEELYGLFEVWVWNDYWYRSYSEEELLDFYEQLKPCEVDGNDF